MGIEFGTDRDVRPDDLPHAGENIALAIVAIGRHHGTVQSQYDHAHRSSGPQIVQNHVAQPLIDRLNSRARGLGEGPKTFDYRALIGFGQRSEYFHEGGTVFAVVPAVSTPRDAPFLERGKP